MAYTQTEISIIEDCNECSGKGITETICNECRNNIEYQNARENLTLKEAEKTIIASYLRRQVNDFDWKKTAEDVINKYGGGTTNRIVAEFSSHYLYESVDPILTVYAIIAKTGSLNGEAAERIDED